jgi:hypothetical protein
MNLIRKEVLAMRRLTKNTITFHIIGRIVTTPIIITIMTRMVDNISLLFSYYKDNKKI